ncbi:MAG: CD1247 N-terminal domain-containing protein [Sulfobacillus sp.]
MADLRRKVSYLSGMAERYDLADQGRQGKILAEMVQVLRELSLDVEEVQANQLELEEYVEEIDSDLMTLEEDVYVGTSEDEDDDDDDDLRFEEDDNEGYIELECPVCLQDSLYNEALFDEEGIQLSCPHCGNIVFDSDEDCIVTDDQADEDGFDEEYL